MASTNQPDLERLRNLAEIAKSLFDIDISVEKLQHDAVYCELVFSELESLNEPQLSHLISKLRASLDQSEVVEDTPSNERVESKQPPILYISLAALGGLVIVLMLYFMLNQSSEPQPETVFEAPQAALPKPEIVKTKADKVIKEVESKINYETYLQLHGSNTIGEKLAPALIEGFLKRQGGDSFNWLTGSNPVERTLQFKQDDKHFAVELFAHGSSTAFKGLNNNLADIAMASRKIKANEITQLKAKAGDLSKVGNEHIIALDGLAVIVNQNSPINSMSTETLAKIFAGEITNWAEIGGENHQIAIYARDKNSGTWDTFKSLVLKKYKKPLAKNAQRFESSSELTERVSQDEFAIGFIGLNYIGYNKALAISEGAGTKPIYPTRFTIATEDYALSRRLYLYTPTNSPKKVKQFAHFAISDEGQKIVQKLGLISQNIRVETVMAQSSMPKQYFNYAQNGKRLSLNFRFNYANKQLDNKGKRDLERLVKYVENNPSKQLVLMGFSDSIGAKEKNKMLSKQRAKVVESELNARGITVLAVEGFGESLPVANNDSELGRERNRRVEVWVL